MRPPTWYEDGTHEMAKQRPYRQSYYLYCLATGIAGMAVLTLLFARAGAPIDLFTALLFTTVALIVAYFRIPIRSANAAVGLDGAVLLGATLVGGPTLGGWTSFVTGLVKSFPPFMPRGGSQGRWLEHTASALWSSGRNVLAVATAWWAYQGMGGTLSPVAIPTSLGLALILFFIVYALVRCFLAWPAFILQSHAPKRALANAVSPTTLAVELAPLPTAVLIAGTFTELGHAHFFLLVLAFTGLGALMKRMLDTMQRLREQRDKLTFANEVVRSVDGSPSEINDLAKVAYRLCTGCAPATHFEIGLYDPSSQHVHIQVASYPSEGEGATPGEPTTKRAGDRPKLTPMRVPITPLWAWIRAQKHPVVLDPEEESADLPAGLLPLDRDEAPYSLLVVPLVSTLSPAPPAEGTTTNASPPSADDVPPPPRAPTLGAITLRAPYPIPFSQAHVMCVAIVGKEIAAAVERGVTGKASVGSMAPTGDPRPEGKG